MELNPNLPKILILVTFAIPLSYYDLKYQRLPIGLTLPSLSISLIFQLLQADTVNFVLAGGVGFVFIYFIRIVTKKGIGLGDALVSALLGLLLGFRTWLAAILSGTMLAVIISLGLLGIKKIDRRTKIPLAPFLFTGGILMMILELAKN